MLTNFYTTRPTPPTARPTFRADRELRGNEVDNNGADDVPPGSAAAKVPYTADLAARNGFGVLGLGDTVGEAESHHRY